MATEQPSSTSGSSHPETNPRAKSTTRPTRQPTTADDLRRLLRLRLARHLAASEFRPALTVVGFDGHRSVALRHGVDHPEDAVLGFVLPVQYSAIGVVASSVVSTTPGHSHRNAALAIGVSRDGDVVSLLATANDVIDTYEPQGWLIDACLRSVDHSTPPCQHAALAFPIALWLDRLMVAILGASSSQPVGWDDAVAMCPVPARWRSRDPIDLGTTLGSTTRSWKALRAATAHGTRSPIGITPERAQWMDDAMFARWCLGSFPELASLRSDVEFLASPHLAERVALTVRAAWAAFSEGS